MGEIGRALLPLDRPQGTAVVEQAIAMATRPADRVTIADLEAPEQSQIGVLVQLARSLQPYPELAGSALRAAYAEAQGNRNPTYRLYAMCLFAREAAAVDPEWARSAARQASSSVAYLRDPTPADPFAVVASVVAQVESAAAARPFVQLALHSIPTGAARPLVEARVAAWLANAAPDPARALARRALADAGDNGHIEGRIPYPAEPKAGPPVPNTESALRYTHERPNAAPQYHDIAVLLAAAVPDVALAAVARLPTAADQSATLVEMGKAVEARDPARAAALFRRGLRAAGAIADRRTRQAAVIEAATGLAAYDLAAARRAVLALSGPVPVVDVMLLAARAAKREPEAAGRLLAQLWDGDPAGGGAILGGDELALAQVATEPVLTRALAMAQQGPPDRQAQALLTVARRLEVPDAENTKARRDQNAK